MGRLFCTHSFFHSLAHTHTFAQTRLPWQHVIKSLSMWTTRTDRPTNTIKARVCLCRFIRRRSLGSVPLCGLLVFSASLSSSGAAGREGQLYPAGGHHGIGFKLPEVQTRQQRRCRCPPRVTRTSTKSKRSPLSLCQSFKAGRLSVVQPVHYHSAADPPLILTSTYIKD